MSELLGFFLVFVGMGVTFVILPTYWIEVDEHRRPRQVECPDTKRRAFAWTDARKGAAACMGMPVRLRVLACSLWPRPSRCAEGCLQK